MLVKQIRFTNIEIATELLSFKGFVVEKNNTILDTTYTILKGPSPSEGSLDGLIINSSVNYSTIVNIEYPLSVVRTLEIIVSFQTEIDIDSIRCVCGPFKENHFKKIVIDTKATSGDWVRFNDANYIPDFVANDLSSKTGFTPILISSSNIDNFFKDEHTSTNNTASFTYIGRNKTPIKTGKYFVEVSIRNFVNSDGLRWNCPIGLIETTSNLNQFSDTGRYCYQTAAKENGFALEKITNGSYSILQTVGTGLSNSAIWPELTAGLFIDLDNNKIKVVFNGVFQTAWFDITKSNANASFYLFIQYRNMGGSFRYKVNTVPLYSYSDLTPEYKTDLLNSKKGWIRHETVGYKRSGLKLQANDNSLIKRRGNNVLDYKAVSSYAKYRLTDVTDTGNGYCYFKNSVFIDYPPKEPTSKRVVLFSIIDGKALQQVWSDPLTGQYEFKFIALRKPYLIFTYDSDEDYNAVILGPVYPTLMPQFEGIVKP